MNIIRPSLRFLFALLAATVDCQAQDYLTHLQQKTQGQGTVTVHQSKGLNELVNGKKVTEEKKTNTTTTPSTTKTTTATTAATEHAKKTVPETAKKATPDSAKKVVTEAPKKTAQETIKKQATETAKKTDTEKEETETPSVDMHKKVMRKSYKVTGYRVQAYAGGNSREDRQKAEKAGNDIKMKYPDQPIYVHFYSPRWICRVGNFRSLSDAQKMLAKVKAMGYKQACLVKGQITVQN